MPCRCGSSEHSKVTHKSCPLYRAIVTVSDSGIPNKKTRQDVITIEYIFIFCLS